MRWVGVVLAGLGYVLTFTNRARDFCNPAVIRTLHLSASCVLHALRRPSVNSRDFVFRQEVGEWAESRAELYPSSSIKLLLDSFI